MAEADIVKLRELGLSDEQILSVVLITCEYNFMTRLADGLGVEVSPQREEYVKQWIAGPAAEQEWLFRRKLGLYEALHDYHVYVGGLGANLVERGELRRA